MFITNYCYFWDSVEFSEIRLTSGTHIFVWSVLMGFLERSDYSKKDISDVIEKLEMRGVFWYRYYWYWMGVA